MKEKIKYFILIILVFSLIVLSTLSVLYIGYSERGSVFIFNKYYDILFDSVYLDSDSSMSVKVNENEIVVKIPNLSEFNIENGFDINISNVGNMDAFVESFSIMNIDSNVDSSSVLVDVSLKDGSVIEGGRSEVINVNIKNLVLHSENDYFNFVIKYNFNEVII